MSYILSLSKDGEYISLKVKGDIFAKLALEYNLMAHAMGRELGINRYFIDLTSSKNCDTLINNYNFAYKDMNEPGIDKSACVAMLVNKGDNSHDIIETFLRNAGLNVTLFTDRETAIQHLKPDGSTDQKRTG